VRLYRAPWSTNVQRVTMALAHKGLHDYDETVISYDDRSPVEAVSGQPLVPVIEFDDGAVVADSMAIVAALEERFPDPPLFPVDPAGRAHVELFCDWFNRVWKLAPNTIEAGGDVAALSAEMDAHLDLFERMLTGRDWFFYGAIGAADLCAYPFLKYAASRDPADDEPFHRILDEHQSVTGRPHLAAWIERVSASQQRGL